MCAVLMKRYKRMCSFQSEKVCLKVISATMTVSTEAKLVVVGLVPFDFLSQKRKRLHRSGNGHKSDIKVE